MSTLVKQDQFGRIRYAASTALFVLMISAALLAQTSHSAATFPAQNALSASRVPSVAVAGTAEARTGATQDAAIADKYATVFGAKIHYLDAGSGPVVILLHGLGGSTANWAPTIAPLAQKYRVIVPDQIGFGKSDKPLLNYRVGTLVDFLDGFYKQVGIQKASLVGNSLGGFTAAAFAIAHPEKVDKLVLVDAAGFAITGDLDPKVLNGLNASTRQGVKDIISLVFYNSAPFSSDAALDAFLTSRVTAGDGYTIQRFIDSIARGEDTLDGKLGAVKHPTLIIWGREDGLTPLAMGQRFNKEIAGSQMFIIEKCGHVPQLEKAAEFNAGLMKFLSGVK